MDTDQHGPGEATAAPTAAAGGDPVAPPVVPVAASAHASVPQRGKAAHVALFALVLVAWFGIAAGLPFLVSDAITEDWYLSQAALDAAAARATLAGFAAQAVFAFATIGLITRQVGYRVRDTLMAYIPFYGLFFVGQMLWRWTALPDRPWEPVAPEPPELPASAEAPAPPPVEGSVQRPFPIQLVAGVLGLLLVAGGVVYVVAQRDAGGDGWQVSTVDGMSIELPATYNVFTDPADVAQAVSELQSPAVAGFAELIRSFPDLFVLLAFEPLQADGEVGNGILIMRYPSGGLPLHALADDYVTGVEGAGYEIIARTDTTVGRRGYPAVRLDNEGQGPELTYRSRDIDYVLEGASQTAWVVTLSTPSSEFNRTAPTFERIIATLVLP